MSEAPRRSPRLLQLQAAAASSTSESDGLSSMKRRPKASNPKPYNKTTVENKPKKARGSVETNPASVEEEYFLPRTREMQLKSDIRELSFVIGVDEAGRGPLAGPVVAAAAVIPENIAGVVDSKKLTKEEKREELYEKIVTSPNCQWAVAIVDSTCIDEINILQATMLGMRMATQALIDPPRKHAEASAQKQGCYIVYGRTDDEGNRVLKSSTIASQDNSSWFAVIDGNRVPEDIPCKAEALIKGDSREYAIAAASILAKVTRDRLMREYDDMYPQYQLGKHKGYPTALHMAAVRTHGASPIHRRTFAPLKHMTFDENGRVVEEELDS